MNERSSRTSLTLLLRLRDPSDQEAWSEFLDRYGPRIFTWCRRHHLQEADATDVTQEVLTKLVQVMRTFEYNPSRGSFRAWLKTVTNNTVRDLAARWSRLPRGTGDWQNVDALESIQAPDALAALTAELQAQAEWELVREAQERVRLRVKPHTWQAYQRTVLERQAAADVAQSMGIPITDVYVAKSRVIKLLRQEIDKLDSGENRESTK